MVKYQEIVRDIEDKINRGELKLGEKLASLRELAGHYNSSKTTVARGVTELKRRGLVYVKDRSGYFVLGKSQKQPLPPSQLFDFSSKGVNWHDFPYEDFQRCLTTAMTQQQAALSFYGQPKGVPALITSLVELLSQYGVYAREEAVYVTSGIQEALYLLSQLRFPNQRTTILVENPTYDTYLTTLRLLGCPVVSVERTLEGLDLQAVEKQFQTGTIKFFYTMPRLHKPLGTNLSKETQLKLLALGERYDVYLVEDDYLADYHRGAQNLPLYYYDTKDRVIYLKSFSKIIFPGLRLGAVVLPEKLRLLFEQYKLIVNIATDSLSQIAMATYLSNGMYEKNRQYLVDELVGRARVMEGAFDQYLDGVRHVKGAGIHSCLVLLEGLSKTSLVTELAQREIYVDDLADSFLAAPSQSLLKLNVTNIKSNAIVEGIQGLASSLRRHQQRLI